MITEPLLADGKIASSKIAPFHYIPTEAFIELANRFQVGVDRKGDKAWNATTPNQEALLDKELTIERISHVIDHALKLRDKLIRGESATAEDSSVGDAAAITWGGVFLICALKAQEAAAINT